MKRLIFVAVILALVLITMPLAMASDVSSLIEEGNRLWSENKMEEARASFQKAIEVAPESATAYARIGALLVMQNHNEEAVAAYQEAITREPGNASYFAALSIAYLHMGYHEMALAMVNQALELNPDMRHASDISKYIDAKLQRMSQVAAEERHGSAAALGSNDK